MTKSEELKLLEQIEKLISSADEDSYIRRTFSGVPEICKQNIESDFWISPVEELDEERERHMKADVEHGNRLLDVERERDILRQEVENKDANIATLNCLLDAKTAECDRIKEERDVIVECHDTVAEMCDKYEHEIMRLKAEVYDLRKWGESPVVPEGV